MDNKPRGLDDCRVQACTNFCVGISTEVLETGWTLGGILWALTIWALYGNDAVGSGCEGILADMEGWNDPKAD